VTDPFDVAQKLIVRLCAEEAFTPPREDETILDWADTVMDSPLAPRGSRYWQEGHEIVLAALTAATQKNEPIAREEIRAARFYVQHHGKLACECSPRPIGIGENGSSRKFCSGCHLRQR
jgi:hypothetical protein